WNLTGFWKNGDLVISPLQLDIRPDTPTGGYWLETGFYETFSQRPLGPPVRIGPLRVAGPAPATTPGEPRAVLGEEEIELLGASWSGEDVTLRWRARRKPAGDYTVFVHALDRAGKV